MSIATTNLSSCTDSSTFLSRLKQLLPTGSLRTEQITSKASARLANAAAISLVTASAGLGAYYAWSVAYSHGACLAALFVLFAVGLELAKPLAVAAAFASFRHWAVARGAALAILAALAVCYSLTAELSLMATTRGDTVASREATIKATIHAEADRKRAVARNESATAELASLPNARPSKELQAEIDGLLLTPGADGCVAINGRITRDVCPKVAELRKELARAERRTELEAVIAAPLPVAISARTDDGHNVRDADPGAKALATYLALLGIVIAPAVLSEWLVLVPVLALEIGSAFAGVLVQSFAAPRMVQASALSPQSNRKEPVVQKPAKEQAVPVVQARLIEISEAQPTVCQDVKKRIVNQLKANGGSAHASERGLAKLIGTSKPTARRALQGLIAAGVIAAEAGRNGTLLRLVA